MPIRITTRHNMELPEPFRAVVQRKLERLLAAFDKVEHLEVIFNQEKSRNQVEILMQSGQFHAAALVEDTDLGSAFDSAMQRVRKQIRRSKDREAAKRTHLAARQAGRRKAASLKAAED
jgi:ribosomal subunit interface protein